MRVFEFHFNPKLRPDLIFDSFCYEPENIYEKRMGNLYLVGLLKNALPQNLHFLDKLQKVIQKEYYRSTIRKPEKGLKESLREANEFLEQIAKKGDVSWLGNLSFAVLSFKNYELNFTKVGDLKIFLLRRERIIDIDRKLKFEEITPWPLKIFGNIVSGKLAEGDILLVSTKEVTDFFEKENLLPEIGKIWPVDEKRLKEIFDKKREEVLKISGLCLVIILTKEAISGRKEVISPKTYPREFNLKEVFSPFLNFFKKIKLPVLPRPKLSHPLKWPEINLPKFQKPAKGLILVLALIFFLALGFFISQFQEKKELKKQENILKEIQEKVNRAESFLILKMPQAEKEANLLLKESWQEISQLSKIVFNLPKDFQERVFSLKNDVFRALSQLNKLEIIEEPKLFFNFSPRQFIPQKMVFFQDELYFFSPYSPNLCRINKNAQDEIIEINQKFNFAAPFEETIFFFAKPNQLTILKDGQFRQIFLEKPYPGFDFDDFSVFRGHLYFLDSNPTTFPQGNEIIKYPYLGDLKWGLPQLWLALKERKTIKARSLAVDGSIWLLSSQQKNKGWTLNRYHLGQLQEKIVLEIFPEPKEFKKIFTSPTLPYLYLSEPAQKKIVILDKKGQIVKQFQSEKFDNLIDFTLGNDGKTIYVLNGLKVYQINFSLP